MRKTLSVEFGGLMTDPWGNVKAGFSITGKINHESGTGNSEYQT
ncbi:MAG TPA: hypothetical protein VIK07_03220 [Bacteroidales bacterium]